MLGALRELFRPEFLNRVDETIVFKPLTKDELVQIVDLLLAMTQEALDNKDIKLQVNADAKKLIAENGMDLKFGARPLRRAIQRMIEDEIAEMVLRNQVVAGQTVYVSVNDGKLAFNVQ